MHPCSLQLKSLNFLNNKTKYSSYDKPKDCEPNMEIIYFINTCILLFLFMFPVLTVGFWMWQDNILKDFPFGMGLAYAIMALSLWLEYVW